MRCWFHVVMAAAKPLCPPDDPWVTGCLYCVQLLHIDPSEPLYGIKYYGQAVRVGGANDVVKARWKEEVRQASRTNKQIGFIAALDMYGEDAFEWTLIMSLEGRRSRMQELMDIGEKGLIAEAGGSLRDMDKRLDQTLNQTNGGSGNARWTGIDAFRKKAFKRFKTEMEAYVAEYGSSLVKQSYVNPLTGYKLGRFLNDFRQGHMRDGMPNQKEVEEWAQALPDWSLNARNTEKFRNAQSKRSLRQWANQTDEAKVARVDKFKATFAATSDEVKSTRNAKRNVACNTDEHKSAISNRMIKYFEDETDDKKATRLANIKAGHNTPEYTKAAVQRGREWMKNEPEKNKADRLDKIRKTCASRNEQMLAQLSGKARKSKEKALVKSARGNAKRANDLLLLRTVEPNAKQSDVTLARREGRIPTALIAPKTTVV